MKKLIAILIMLIIVAIGLLMMYQNLVLDGQGQKEEEIIVITEEEVEFSEAFNNIMAYDFDEFYPPSYIDVVEINNEITVYQYGREVILQEAEDLVAKQRELFAVELLEVNTFENQLDGYLIENNKRRQADRYIESRKILSSEILVEDGSVAQVIVIEINNDGLEMQYTYFLTKEEDNWKIFSWESKTITEPTVKEISEGGE